MLLDIVEVQPKPGYKLILTFENGEIRVFDCGKLIEERPFEPLSNPAFFNRARIEYGTVVWPGEIDIAPETLYLESRIVQMEGFNQCANRT
jgi:hypothetical protein